METLILTTTETVNPFSLDLNKETLFNIRLGKAANKEATLYLLHLTHTGNRARKEFTEECKSNPKGFEERLKKQKILSFAKKGANFKLNNKIKIMEVNMERGLYERILFHALQRKVDTGEMLKFSLASPCKRLLNVHCLKT